MDRGIRRAYEPPNQMSTTFTNRSEQNRQDPSLSSSTLRYRERSHDVVFTPVAAADYDLDVAAVFKRLGVEYDELASRLFDGDPEVTTDIQPAGPEPAQSG